MNLPNKLTLLRVFLVPVFVIFMLIPVPWGRWVALAVFIIASLTDTADGYIARKYNLVTDFGKFIDPIADKLEVVMALAFLLERGLCSSWVLLVVVAREFLVSGLRMVVASQGVVIAASNLGKAKTATTMVAIGGYLLCAALPAGSFTTFLHTLSLVLMVAAVILTAWSGIDYFIKSWPTLNKMDS